MHLILRLIINAIALWVALQLVPGIQYNSGDLTGLLILAVIFGVVNAIIRPIVKLFSLPLLVLTLGLFTIVINALMLWLASVIGQQVGIPFYVQDVSAALLGSIVISVVSIVLSLILHE